MTTISNRPFGCELEIIGLSCVAAYSVIVELGLACNNINGWVNPHSRQHTTWRIMTDSSIHSERESCEVVSPILRGEDGLQELAKVCNALSVAGATVNRSCGFHVHVYAHDLETTHIRNIAERYARYESIIDTWMPRSRRGRGAAYVSTIRNQIDFARRQAGWMTNNVAALAHAWGSRYYKLNLCSLRITGTIEFRHHSGTVDATKATNWVRFCVAFIEASSPRTLGEVSAPSRTRSGTHTGSTRRGRRARNGAVHRVMAVLRSANDYLTAQQIADAAEVSASSLPVYFTHLRNDGHNIQNVRGRGYMLTVDAGNYNVHTQGEYAGIRAPRRQRNPAPYNLRGGRAHRGRTDNNYNEPTETTQAPVAPTVAQTPENDNGVFTGIPSDVVAYYQERAQDLAA